MNDTLKQAYTSILENAVNLNEWDKDALCYGKGVSEEQRFFWLITHFRNLEHDVYALYSNEPSVSDMEEKRHITFFTEILKLVTGFLLYTYKKKPIVISYTLDKIELALQKHPKFDVGFCDSSISNASYVVESEIIEFLYALKSEKKDRQIAEAFDVAVTATRFLNHEYD